VLACCYYSIEETKVAAPAAAAGAPFKAEPVFAELKKRADADLVKKVIPDDLMI
jgi:hypothetical protein